MPSKHNLYRALFAVALGMAMGRCADAPRELRVVGLSDLQTVIEGPGEAVRVINFWATWCAPCVKEMPLFEELNKSRRDVEVTLVSLDMDMDPNADKVRKFVKEKEIKSQVLILDAGDPNEWIDKVDAGWSGALPATLVINSKTGKRVLIEKELHAGDLEALIAQVQ